MLTSDFIENYIITELKERRQEYGKLTIYHIFLPRMYKNLTPTKMYIDCIHEICNTLDIDYGYTVLKDYNTFTGELYNMIDISNNADDINGVLIDAPFNNRDFLHLWNPDMNRCKDIELFYSSYHNHTLLKLENPYLYTIDKIKYHHNIPEYPSTTIFTNWNRSYGKIIPVVDYGFNTYTLNNLCNIRGIYSSDIIISLTELRDNNDNDTVEYNHIKNHQALFDSHLILDFNSINNSEGSPFNFMLKSNNTPVYGWNDILMKLYILGCINNLLILMEDKK